MSIYDFMKTYDKKTYPRVSRTIIKSFNLKNNRCIFFHPTNKYVRLHFKPDLCFLFFNLEVLN